uniref:Uncharacterized protein n=1 Tax=Populus alba TaxID=43335 RepID=A0A4V6AAE7_POPAL|nr:hypothetical protein D5086_0000103170 [Populus alba]
MASTNLFIWMHSLASIFGFSVALVACPLQLLFSWLSVIGMMPLALSVSCYIGISASLGVQLIWDCCLAMASSVAVPLDFSSYCCMTCPRFASLLFAGCCILMAFVFGLLGSWLALWSVLPPVIGCMVELSFVAAWLLHGFQVPVLDWLPVASPMLSFV